jgi:PPP family 3-phenylpropionic acid transporter
MLRLFYVCYFTAVGVSVPFFTPYLRGLGLSGLEISALLSLAPLCHLGVPLCWGWFADRTQRPDVLLRVACLGACLCLLPLLYVRTLPALVYVYAAHQVFAVAILALMDSMAIDRVRREGGEYARIRLWGSVSFMLACWLCGLWLDARARPGGDPLVPLLMTAALGVTVLASLSVRGHPGTERPHAHDLRRLLRDRRFLLLLVVAPLHWACTAPYHGFLGVLVRDRGLPASVTGSAFALSVLCELGAFFFFRRLRQRFSLPALLAVVTAASAVRWAVVAVSTSTVVLVAVQALHALTFGVFWGTAMAWLAACVPPSLRATGQALYATATSGLGSLLGIYGAGLLYDATGGAAAAFAAAAALELVPLALVLTVGRKLGAGAGLGLGLGPGPAESAGREARAP